MRKIKENRAFPEERHSISFVLPSKARLHFTYPTPLWRRRRACSPASGTDLRYHYTQEEVEFYCRTVFDVATVVTNVPEIRVVRDPNDDVILASAIAAGADYLVTRDKDLLSLGAYEGISIIKPEAFLHVLRGQSQE